MKQKLIQRQEELTKEFETLKADRQALLNRIGEMDIRMNQLTGAYTEITKQLKELEPEESVETEEICVPEET